MMVMVVPNTCQDNGSDCSDSQCYTSWMGVQWAMTEITSSSCSCLFGKGPQKADRVIENENLVASVGNRLHEEIPKMRAWFCSALLLARESSALEVSILCNVSKILCPQHVTVSQRRTTESFSTISLTISTLSITLSITNHQSLYQLWYPMPMS